MKRPMLALTKRTDVVKVDLTQAVAEPTSFSSRIAQWVFNRDNYGIKALGLDEEMQQFDTSLADLDAVIMTQYQLVAVAANVRQLNLWVQVPKGLMQPVRMKSRVITKCSKVCRHTQVHPYLNVTICY